MGFKIFERHKVGSSYREGMGQLSWPWFTNFLSLSMVDMLLSRYHPIFCNLCISMISSEAQQEDYLTLELQAINNT